MMSIHVSYRFQSLIHKKRRQNDFYAKNSNFQHIMYTCNSSARNHRHNCTNEKNAVAVGQSTNMLKQTKTSTEQFNNYVHKISDKHF